MGSELSFAQHRPTGGRSTPAAAVAQVEKVIPIAELDKMMDCYYPGKGLAGHVLPFGFSETAKEGFAPVAAHTCGVRVEPICPRGTKSKDEVITELAKHKPDDVKKYFEKKGNPHAALMLAVQVQEEAKKLKLKPKLNKPKAPPLELGPAIGPVTKKEA